MTLQYFAPLEALGGLLLRVLVKIQQNERFIELPENGFDCDLIKIFDNPMPVDFLTTTQRQRYGRYPDSLSPDELARNFHLDDDDREWIANKRRDSSRLGFALQLATVRFLGTFLEDPVDVPPAVLHALAAQTNVVDPHMHRRLSSK